jgi:hypothetical protein
MDLSEIAAAMGRRGGKARAQKMTPEQRSAAARKAAKASAKVRSAKAAQKKRSK